MEIKYVEGKGYPVRMSGCQVVYCKTKEEAENLMEELIDFDREERSYRRIFGCGD